MKPFERLRQEFSGKQVLIVGLGLLGRSVSVASTLVRLGARIKVTDLRNASQLGPSLRTLKGLSIEYHLGGHSPAVLEGVDVLIRNPAVPWNHELLNLARSRRIPVLMDTALLARFFPGKIIGITGTRGKSTTTWLIFSLVRKLVGRKARLAGNATRTANILLLRQATTDSIAVAELSSWELQGWRQEKRSPSIAVITNIYSDHLDRYPSLAAYIRDKEAIFAFQEPKDALILNQNNRHTRAMSLHAPSRVHWFKATDLPGTWKPHLFGEHNRENLAAARRLGLVLGIPAAVIRTTLERFAGLPHRLETVAKVNGVTFINDTTATTPVAVVKALAALSSPVILLVGGNSKNLPVSGLAKAIDRRVKGLVWLRGNGTQKLRSALNPLSHSPVIAEGLPFREAVLAAAEKASPGDVVLLSPGFTSFAEFSNEFERGDDFRAIVRQLQQTRKRKGHHQ